MSAGQGLQITLSAMPDKLTVDKNGRQILSSPMVFQIPPLEEYSTAHAFNFGTYDTIAEGEFMRWGSLQAATWQFDTLAMYLDTDTRHHVTYPRWVPFPEAGAPKGQKRDPTHYLGLLRALHNAGCPFRYVAVLPGVQVIRRSWAVLTAFSEDYKHGEGDAIYFTGLSFAEWNDPAGPTALGDKARGYSKLPVAVRFKTLTEKTTAGPILTPGKAYIVNSGKVVPGKGETTLAQLARYFYGDATKWRVIAKANGLTGGDGSTLVWARWYSHKLQWFKTSNVGTLIVPALNGKRDSQAAQESEAATEAAKDRALG